MIRRLLFRNFRFIYRLSQFARHRFTPAGFLILGGFIGSGIFGIDTRQSLAFQIFALTASLLIISLISIIIFRGNFRIRRQLPEYGTVGKAMQYRLYLDNLDKRLQKELLIIDELDTPVPKFDEFIVAKDPQDQKRNWFDRVVGYPRLMGLIQKKRGASIQPVALEQLSGAEQLALNMKLFPVRRGYLHFVTSRITRPDPLGLMRAIQTKQNKDSLLILPRIYRLPPIQLQGTRRYQRGGMNLTSTVGESQEFMSLRDYRPGDPLRAIHWRSYAKTGHPVVKEFQDEFFVRQGLLLDTFIEDKSEDIFEEAVSVAASFIVSVKQQDALLDLMFIGTEAYRFTTGRGLGKTENMLEILACVEPCHDKSFAKLNHMIRQHTHETSGLICILLDWDEKRKELVKSISALAIPVLVFLVTEGEPDKEWDTSPLTDHTENFHVLNPGRIQYTLDQIKTLGDRS